MTAEQQPELLADVLADLFEERVRWADVQAALAVARMRSWDEADFEFTD